MGFPGEESLVHNFCSHKILLSATGVTGTRSQGAELGLAAKTTEGMIIEATGEWGPCADVRRSPRQGVALAVVEKAYDVVEVHRVLAHPNEENMQKTIQAMGIVTTGQWGPCEERLQVEAKRQAMQWIDGPDKTGSNGVGDEDLDVKPGEDESVGKEGLRNSTYRKWRWSSRRIPIRGHRRRRRTSRGRHGRCCRIPRRGHRRRCRIPRKKYERRH